MNKVNFEEMFENALADDLVEMGFKSYGRSLSYSEEKNNISLIRLGGRKAAPGQISHLLCFRHTFLPNLNDYVPTKFESEVFSYPIKLKPSSLAKNEEFSLRYCPQNLNYRYESFDFLIASDEEVEHYLQDVNRSIRKLLDWCSESRVKWLENQIKKNGENAWVERMWLESYELYMST